MGRDGPISGNYTGERNYTGRNTFFQGASGAGIQITMDSNIWYVDKGKTTGVTGGGTTWDDAKSMAHNCRTMSRQLWGNP